MWVKGNELKTNTLRKNINFTNRELWQIKVQKQSLKTGCAE